MQHPVTLATSSKSGLQFATRLKIIFWSGTNSLGGAQYQNNFGQTQKIWTGTKHFGTCRRTRHKLSPLQKPKQKPNSQFWRVKIQICCIVRSFHWTTFTNSKKLIHKTMIWARMLTTVKSGRYLEF